MPHPIPLLHLWSPGNSWVRSQKAGASPASPPDASFPSILPYRPEVLTWVTEHGCAPGPLRLLVGLASPPAVKTHFLFSPHLLHQRSLREARSLNYAFLIDLSKPLLPFFMFRAVL